MSKKAVSPASSGPAGSHFEGQVGAHYLLTMLAGSAPRGLPGTTIERIGFQQAAEDRPLDDVIIHGRDSSGKPAILEIQVKRSITFAPGDSVFKKIVAQIVQASQNPNFWNSRYELAIATSQTSRKIAGPYQDVLTWARQLRSAETFFDRIKRPGSANNDMRTFVSTFTSHLTDAGATNDDQAVWRLLRKLQILVFDFTAQGSTSEEFAKERAVRVLHPDETDRVGNLWTSLIELTVRIAASAGERTRAELIEDLKLQSFRLAGERRHLVARTALAEASRNALADVSYQVGDVMLTRHDRIAAVRTALEEGRYVEIRGDTGTGKSGVMKHFAEQLSTEAQVIVLSPGRTTAGGWTAMRAVLGFDGTARELLSELAAGGAATLFLDGLDIFNKDERRTVTDLVRETANVPGIAVLATARQDFGVEEPNWLPIEALETLGRATPVIIGELNEAEIEELRHADPKLSALLADNHPARDVARNLFRLARLANLPADEPVPRTEIDMAAQWWQTADGNRDGRRERARVLKALAEQALLIAEPLNVSDLSSNAVNALVRSETLRDLGNDRVAFRHDVFREWAIANLLYFEPATIECLPLDRPAPTSLARGIELTARMALECSTNAERWKSLLRMASPDNAHGSWRRAVLLALVRSEVGLKLLDRTSDQLLEDQASLLCELIRTVKAVDVVPASDRFAAMASDSVQIPEGLYVPSKPSWHRLISWLLRLGENLPVKAIPDVVNLYSDWSIGMLGLDPLTPEVQRQIYLWLMKIEENREVEAFRGQYSPFGDELNHDQVNRLEDLLRTTFLLFCIRTPSLAVDYLRFVERRRQNDNVVQGILKFRGTLAQAAPKELARLTAAALIPTKRPEEQYDYHPKFEEPFEFLDHKFVPASPAQGPFLELLIYAPKHGLSLVRQLVDHAVLYYSNGKAHGSDAITIPFPDSDREFPWERSYVWSREGAGHYCVTSALMALEAWAHRRIEAGEPCEEVVADVLGTPGAPAAYLMVAVDLLLSHWPKSREIAIPFLACPELLCVDRERRERERFDYPDFFGLKAFQKEPVGAANLSSLKERSSRRLSLDYILRQYAVFGPAELRERLVALLRRAAARLGPPAEQSDLGDPVFMVVHALNLLDPDNWQETLVELSDGTKTNAWQYVSPQAESQHLQALQEAFSGKLADSHMQGALGLVLEDQTRSSPEFAARAVNWAQREATNLSDNDADEAGMRKEAIFTAALIAMRDGNAELRTQQEAWARRIFSQALQTQEDRVYRFRSGLRFNPFAIAFFGMALLLRDSGSPEDVRALLEMAGREDVASAQGFGAAAAILADIDERLPRAVLRIAFVSRVRPTPSWDLSEEQKAARTEQYRRRVEAAVDAEAKWLTNECPEPNWPTFPLEQVRTRHRIRIPGKQRGQEDSPKRQPRREEYTDHQGATLWLRGSIRIFDAVKSPWMYDIVRTYSRWTAKANGAGLNEDEEIARPPRDWNNAYFDLLVRCLAGLPSNEIDELALTPISSLPDEAFFDVVAEFLKCIDAVYFNDGTLKETEALRIRSALAHRLTASQGWQWLRGSQSTSIEMHIGPAVAAFFFNDCGFAQPPKCYLNAKGIDRLEPFIPVLEELIGSGTSLFVALVTLDLLEVSPKPAHLPFAVNAAKTWMADFPHSSEFWVDSGIGQRTCALVDRIRKQDNVALDSEDALRRDVDALLAALIRLGVAEASRLEMELADG